jgi:hypothetical protein
MSTKNLARTIIEGGRTRWSRQQRRHSNSEHRTAERDELRKISTGGDDDACFERRPGVFRDFDDKLGPAWRWLDRQVGRPWNLVRSELLRRFDTRTTPGRHIVFCHMLPEVEGNRLGWRWHRFEVDRHGILRRLPRRPYRHVRGREPLPRPEPELDRWRDCRRVGERGGVLFWFTLTPAGAYRQDHRLETEDAELWRSLPDWYRNRHQPGAPLPPLPEC